MLTRGKAVVTKVGMSCRYDSNLWCASLLRLCPLIVMMESVNMNAKQKHLGSKKVRGQSEATLQTGRRDQKV